MKKLLVGFFLLCQTHLFAQKPQYIVFEERALPDTTTLAPFKLAYNHIALIQKNEEKPGLNILNLYFSKYNFKAYGLDRKAFIQGVTDYHKIENDILITITPLTDSLKSKMIKLSDGEVRSLSIIKPEELLRNAVKNLYRCFTENDIARDDIPGIVKFMKYKLLIKKKNVYYRVDAPILTEYYLIDRASYLFPSQYHYAEINVASKQQTRYFTGDDIDTLLQQNPSGTMNDNFPIKTIAGRTFISSAIVKDSCLIYTYWTYPGYAGRILGIGRFQFIEGIGIVNGTYGTYFDKHFMITLENSERVEDFNGEFKMKLQSINGKSLKQIFIEMNKFKKSGQIIPVE